MPTCSKCNKEIINQLKILIIYEKEYCKKCFDNHLLNFMGRP